MRKSSKVGFALEIDVSGIIIFSFFFCKRRKSLYKLYFRKDTDWGLRQIDSTRDVTNKGDYYFLVATTFGHHTLHHLFPTVDHSKLHLLYPVFEETCKEFGLTFKTIPQYEMFLGLHLQMMRNESKINYVKP